MGLLADKSRQEIIVPSSYTLMIYIISTTIISCTYLKQQLLTCLSGHEVLSYIVWHDDVWKCQDGPATLFIGLVFIHLSLYVRILSSIVVIRQSSRCAIRGAGVECTDEAHCG